MLPRSASSTVVDPLTLRVELVQRNLAFTWTVEKAFLNYVPSAKVSPAELATKPVGAGPFMLKEFRRDDRSVYVANPDWPFWPGGKPHIDELTVRPMVDEFQRFNTLATDQSQLVFTQFYPIRNLATQKGFAFTKTETEGGNTIVFNQNRAPFDDARMRQALQLATDLKAFKAYNCECDEPPIHNLFNDDSPYYDKSQDFPKYDLDAAQKLIDDYVAKSNGGKPVEFTLGHFSTTANTVNATFFQAQWSKLKNVKVSLDALSHSTAGADPRGPWPVPAAPVGQPVD